MGHARLIFRVGFVVVAVAFSIVALNPAHARDTVKLERRISPTVPSFAASAPSSLPPGSTLLASYAFEDLFGACDAQGWISVDRTEHVVNYFHVDDFAGLSGPYTPLSGSQSLWCGARAGGSLCFYASLPGYGNNWEEVFESRTFSTSGDVTVDFSASWDSEPGYDVTHVEYLSKTGTWRSILDLDGIGSGPQSALIQADSVDGNTKIRFRFTSDSGWSDEDGLYGSNGAIIIDDLTVTGSGPAVDFEDFEGESPGDEVTSDGDWFASPPTPFGDYAALYHGPVGSDPSSVNTTCFWGFFDDPGTTNYSCGGYPGTGAIPYGSGCGVAALQGENIQNEIRSPVIPMAGSGSQLFLAFDVYRDLSINSLVFFTWRARFNNGSCWSDWLNDDFIFYGEQQAWAGLQIEVGHVSPYPMSSVTEVQVSLAVQDFCWTYCGSLGTCACHTNSPLFDNVTLSRGELAHITGKVYSDGDANCTFAGADFPIAGRKIVANPGGYTATTSASGDYSLAIPPGTYTVAQVPVSPDPWTLQGCQASSYNFTVAGGATESGKDFALAAVSSPQCNVEVLIVSNGINTGPPPCTPNVLNTPCPGIEHEYCFTVQSSLTSTLPIPAGTDITLSLDPDFTIASVASGDSANCPITVTAAPYPFQRVVRFDEPILPGQMCVVCVRATPGADGPYVTQVVFDDAGLCSGVKSATKTEGSQCSCDPNDKSVDPAGCGPEGNIVGDEPLIYTIRFENVGPGSAHNIFIEDTIDDDLDLASVGVVTSSHAVTGTQIESGNVVVIQFDDIELPGTLDPANNKGYVILTARPKPGLAEGTIIDNTASITFDFNAPVVTNTTINTIRAVPEPVAAYAESDTCAPGATFDFTYTGGTADNASFAWNFGPNATPTTSNAQNPSGVVFSMPGPEAVALTVTRFGCDATVVDTVMVPDCQTISTRDTPPAFALFQNHPNPFNPATTIRYALDRAEHVTLAVFDPSGRLVVTLVDRDMTPGSYEAPWDGRDRRGNPIATGVYFYRLRSGERTLTKKAVLLK